MKKFKSLSSAVLSVLLGCAAMGNQLPLSARVEPSGWVSNYRARHRSEYVTSPRELNIPLRHPVLVQARNLWKNMFNVCLNPWSSTDEKSLAFNEFYGYFRELNPNVQKWVCVEIALGILRVDTPEQWAGYSDQEKWAFASGLFCGSHGVRIYGLPDCHIKIVFYMHEIFSRVLDKFDHTECIYIENDNIVIVL